MFLHCWISLSTMSFHKPIEFSQRTELIIKHKNLYGSLWFRCVGWTTLVKVSKCTSFVAEMFKPDGDNKTISREKLPKALVESKFIRYEDHRITNFWIFFLYITNWEIKYKHVFIFVVINHKILLVFVHKQSNLLFFFYNLAQRFNKWNK